MEETRKRTAKYGRTARKALVHDLFDVASKSDSLYTVVKPNVVTNSESSGMHTPISDVSEDVDVSVQLNSELQADTEAGRVRLKSPFRKMRTAQTPPPPATAMFDIESSDEDKTPVKVSKNKTYKRRRLDGSGADVSEKTGRGRNPATTTDTRSQSTAERSTHSSQASRARTRQKMTGDGLRSNSASGEALERKKPQQPPANSLKPRPRPRPVAILPPPRHITPSPYTPPDPGSPASDISAASMVTTRSASKRKREVGDGIASDVSSPSHLELASLRLTPQREVSSPTGSGERQSPRATSSTTPKRRRLVDQLDTAGTSESEDVRMEGNSPMLRRSTATPKKPATQPPGESPMKPTLSRQSSQQSESKQQGTLKARKYGKQRSHLSDMVGGLSSQSQDSAQRSFDDPEPQVDALVNSQPSQFDFENPSDDDDDDVGVQLKSIHELRQAGAVNRNDRDLESLLDDIQSTSKSARIAGLMQLVRKSQEQAFKRHVLDHGKISRLVECARSDLDLLSASMMCIAFWALTHSESATGHILTQIYQGLLRLPATLIKESRPMAAIAKDRSENLSKALVREVLDFESYVLSSSDKSAAGPRHIIISRIVMKAAEFLVKKLVMLGEKIPTITRSWIQASIDAVGAHLEGLGDPTDGANAEHMESIRLILAWLQLSEAASGGMGKRMTPLQLTEIGQMLRDVIVWAKAGNVALEQTCLKLVARLADEQDSILTTLASTSVTEAIFGVVEEHFPILADRAVSGTTAEEGEADFDRLASVLMALGCMLDFVNSSIEVRVMMIDNESRGASRTDWLVKTFKLYVHETDEVSP